MKSIGKVNSDIADWIAVCDQGLNTMEIYSCDHQERRRVEEAYAQGLKKLANRRPHDASQELGYESAALSLDQQTLTRASIFRTPWQSIVSSMNSRAESHAALATNMQSDVERPLLEFQSKSREMNAVTTVQGNLAAMAREVDGAHKKATKLAGGKTSTIKVANATSDMDAANQQWDSSAPYIFEQLQELDVSRLDHLRTVLLQLETYEVDLVERNRVTAESCLNALLNVDTKDEISTFIARMSGGDSSITPRLGSRNLTSSSSTGAPSSILAQPPTSTPSRARENSAGDAPSPFSTTSSRANTGKCEAVFCRPELTNR